VIISCATLKSCCGLYSPTVNLIVCFPYVDVSFVFNADSSQSSSQGNSQLQLKAYEKKDEVNTTDENKDSTPDVKAPSKPLLPKSAILKLLAELVKSYAGVAQLITDYSHTAKLSSASEVSHLVN